MFLFIQIDEDNFVFGNVEFGFDQVLNNFPKRDFAKITYKSAAIIGQGIRMETKVGKDLHESCVQCRPKNCPTFWSIISPTKNKSNKYLKHVIISKFNY